MIASQDIPNDDNGQVLRRLLKEGDDFTRPRNIDFEFVFEYSIRRPWICGGGSTTKT